LPAVFVHGVPDTAALWAPIIGTLDRTDVVALDLPGFGASRPDGFVPTKERYAAWLAEEIEAQGEPVDLVAHDWGGILALRVASTRPELIRTLAVGGCPVDAEYTWHAMAQLWQTPEAGEQFVEGWLATVTADRVAGLVAGGSPAELASHHAEVMGEEMSSCILVLYRSAVEVGAEWQPGIEAMPARPALVLAGADDAYVPREIAERLARRLDARLVVFDDCGHWWPWERATETAAALESLWAGAPAAPAP
jgi:pimeloyl-ACP methyl ester carboxylesterase